VAKTIQRSIEIDSTPERVWKVLTDFPTHSDWNPFIREIRGDVAVGARLDVQIAPKGGRVMRFKPTVTAATPEQRFAWFGSLGMRGIFDGAHSFVLQDLGGGRTSLTQAETFRGVLVPLFLKGLVGTAEGFEEMNQALKERCETTAV
jgi:hypothetical protein